MPARHKRSNDRARLERGLASLSLEADEATIGKMLALGMLLRKWNSSYNLVSAATLDSLVEQHLLDSIAIMPHLAAGSLLDVGSGAGFPGLPLAIMNPERNCTLLDSSGKKARFLRHVGRTLGLGNVQIVQCRAEDFEPDRKFDNITCRAVAALADFAVSVRHLADGKTRLLAMKGRYPEHELKNLPGWVCVKSVEPVFVPDLHAERHLVIMQARK